MISSHISQRLNRLEGDELVPGLHYPGYTGQLTTQREHATILSVHTVMRYAQ